MARKKTAKGAKPAKASTQHAIRNTSDNLIDAIADWMYRNCPSWSVDMLLCHPERSVVMAIEVGIQTKRLNEADVRGLHFGRKTMNAKEEAFWEIVSGILRAAMGARKQGLLKRKNSA